MTEQFVSPFVDSKNYYVNYSTRLNINKLLSEWAASLEMAIEEVPNGLPHAYLEELICEINKVRDRFQLHKIKYPVGLDIRDFQSWLYPILYETDSAVRGSANFEQERQS